MILGGVCESIKQQIDRQEEDSPCRRPWLALGGGSSNLLARPWVVQGECRNAECNQENHSVFVQGISLAENGQMEEHDWEQFARLGENEGEVVDVRKTCISKWRSKRGRNADEDQREDDLLGREN